ncbi:hypothetical protein LCGC14_0404170 [marine sediment metagenome]|uniref:Uncharacterized protein n=1 Tax=marine sediment metagenome TaxID=412755 RepID=A0A0F9W4Y3_9ZZZZ
MKDKPLKSNKPQSDLEVLEVMQSYCADKGYTFSKTQLDYLAQSCFLCYESKGWKGITYWPPLAMRWVLNNLDKQYKKVYKPQSKPRGQSVRSKIIERENTEQENEV